MAKEIQLPGGLTTIVDDEDFLELSKHSWYVRIDRKGAPNSPYAITSIKVATNKHKTASMHRFIMGVTDPKLCVDHISGDTLDNRRANLRVCTPSENGKNMKRSVKNTSGYKGVSWSKNAGAWSSSIRANGKCYFLGYFECPIEAARFYNRASIDLHGNFGRLNDVSPLFPTTEKGSLYRNNTSGFRGVIWHKPTQKWCVSIRHNKVYHRAGLFSDIEDAARQANKMLFKFYGENAKLNDVSPLFPEGNRYPRPETNTSGFIGVSWSAAAKKWRAQLRRNGKSFNLGCHSTPEAAALAFDAKAREIHGPSYKRLNFPLEQ